MNVKQHIADDSARQGLVIHVPRREGEPGLLPDDPGKMTELLMEEIDKRATLVGPVLEAILHEQHGYSRWGLNE